MEQSASPVVPAVYPPGWGYQSGSLTGGVSTADVGQQMFKCAECETRFTTLTMLEAHMMIHMGNICLLYTSPSPRD